MQVYPFHNLSIGWYSLFVGKHYQFRETPSTAFCVLQAYEIFLVQSVRHTKADSVLLWFPPLKSAHVFLIWLSLWPLFSLCHSFSYPAQLCWQLWQSESQSPKLTSEAYQKIPFFCASDHRTWTLVPLSFIKTNFQILWSTAASRVLLSAFLNHTWLQPFSHCFFVHGVGKYCLNGTNRKMLQYPFTAKP